jgi:hypothetical protein
MRPLTLVDACFVPGARPAAPRPLLSRADIASYLPIPIQPIAAVGPIRRTNAKARSSADPYTIPLKLTYTPRSRTLRRGTFHYRRSASPDPRSSTSSHPSRPVQFAPSNARSPSSSASSEACTSELESESDLTSESDALSRASTPAPAPDASSSRVPAIIPIPRVPGTHRLLTLGKKKPLGYNLEEAMQVSNEQYHTLKVSFSIFSLISLP